MSNNPLIKQAEKLFYSGVSGRVDTWVRTPGNIDKLAWPSWGTPQKDNFNAKAPTADSGVDWKNVGYGKENGVARTSAPASRPVGVAAPQPVPAPPAAKPERPSVVDRREEAAGRGTGEAY
jgi:hypothetical protein